MENNNKIYTISLFFVLISLFLVVFCIFPLLNEIKNSSKVLISLKDNVLTLTSQTVETDNFKRNYNAYMPNLEKIDQLFVDSNNPVDFIKFLEDTALSCQIISKISLPASSKTSQIADQNFILMC
jgi:hypothetical protein